MPSTTSWWEARTGQGLPRADFTSADILLLLENLSARIPVAGERAAALHLRYLDLVLAGLRTSAADLPVPDRQMGDETPRP
ncbi:hypothetical protein OG252_46725 [Streptomyces sp. NBC_01352]|uniref:hypothetical protein n=1 Tax=Streptomyces sp. NBC_01352 TaxID=2903834 RepID=UPI002E34A4F5|nr:hypothetical protein [Streptomyces sp. NBC_01352]